MNRFSQSILASIALAVTFIPQTPAMGTTLVQFDFDSTPNGTTFADISGNGNHLDTISPVSLNASVPSFTPPAPAADRSALFGGANVGYISNPGAIDLNNGGLNQFTFEGWIKPFATQAATLITFYGPSSTRYALGLDLNGDNQLAARTYFQTSGFSGDLLSSEVVPLNDWTHLAAMYDGSTLFLYINGVEVGNTSVGAALSSICDSIVIGGGLFGNTNGLIDDIRISNVVLDPLMLGYYEPFTAIPEPAVATIAGIGMLMLVTRSRKIRMKE